MLFWCYHFYYSFPLQILEFLNNNENVIRSYVLKTNVFLPVFQESTQLIKLIIASKWIETERLKYIIASLYNIAVVLYRNKQPKEVFHYPFLITEICYIMQYLMETSYMCFLRISLSTSWAPCKGEPILSLWFQH